MTESSYSSSLISSSPAFFSTNNSQLVELKGREISPTTKRQQRYESAGEPSNSSSPELDSSMDLDFSGIDCSWQFDHVLLATFDPPYSPIFAVADFSDDKSAVEAAVASTSPDLRYLTCNPEATTSNHKDDNDDGDDKKRLPNPFNGLALLELSEMCLIKERMTQALRYLKESSDHHQILAQIWAPIKSGNRYVLTTSGQPFVLSRHSNGLHHYRTASLMYSFSVEGETDGNLGLPGRVFRQKLPEWTPDVQYYSSKEYVRVKHAKDYNVHGTLALPVFEPSGQSCVGVLELIMTSQKVNYAPEVDKVCKALEAVNLRSSKISDQPNIKICNEGRQNALAEILEVFTEVCESYQLPLAQTWIPCRHQNILAYGGGLKKSCSSFDGSCMEQVCMSTTDVAFYVVEAHMWGFREACAEHHLQKGQGVAGRAFLSKGSCFCDDISRFSKKEYPLVHYAKMFELTSSFAICLRSKYTGEDDYVLEFFLPNGITDSSEQQRMLDSILQIMKLHFRSLMVASGRALEGERNFMEIVHMSTDNSPDLEVKPVLVSHRSEPVTMLEQLIGGAISSLENYDEFFEEKDVLSERNDPVDTNGGNCNGVDEIMKPSGRKRGKAEKQISLEVLQQYFAGSLKDAAKSLGVCPTTMKRICRQHGIPRWPSRKINKVNRSLSKLKLVMESVQGADGAFGFTSFSPRYTPTATVAPISWPAGSDDQQPSPSSKPIEPTGLKIDPHQAQVPSTSTEASTGTSTSNESSQTSPENTFPSNSMALMFQSNGEIDFSAALLLPAQKTSSVIVKAGFKEDTIRFRFPLESNIVGLRDEVARRLKMEVGTFEMKYVLDDDEQITINDGSDLQECLESVRSSGRNVIRLSIHEIMGNLGSSCESYADQ